MLGAFNTVRVQEKMGVNEKDYASFEDFSKAVEEYIDYYNNKRIQQKQHGCHLYNTG